MAPRFSFNIATGDVIALGIFVVVGFTMAGTTEALRKTVEQLSRAEQGKSLLLDELAHRTKNDLAIIGSAITLQARASENDDVREALEAANARVQVVAAAQSRLRASQAGSEIELNGYVQALCSGLGDMLRGIRPIAVRVHCPELCIPESTAVTVGLIVNELVTNSLKYAFPTDRGGIIDVNVTSRNAGGLAISVRDNGAGCPNDASGMGTRLVRLLAKQRGGQFDRTSSEAGCDAVAIIPDLS